MLRVNSSNVLVVPPWECAWLSDEQLQLKDGAGCVCFDVKGDSRLFSLSCVLFDVNCDVSRSHRGERRDCHTET